MVGRARSALLDATVAVALGVTSTFAYTSWFSRRLYDRGAFEAQYGHGVYRHRVLGRELVLAVERAIGNPLAHLAPPRARPNLPGELFSAITVVNLGAFLALAALVHVVLGRSDRPEPHRTLLFTSFLAVVAATGYVVTPYDQLGSALLLAFLVLAAARPPFDLLAPVLLVVGVATRESALVGLAALWVVAWPNRRSDRRAVLVAVASTVAGIAAYAALRVAAGDGASLWAAYSLPGNVGRGLNWIGLAVVVALVAWWHEACRLARTPGTPDAAPWVRRLWVLCLPYLLVAGLTGYWFEARLVVPVLVAELWLRTRVEGLAPGG